MPDTGMLALSVASLIVGSLLVLAPQALVRLSEALNRLVGTLDPWLMRHRYVMALAAFAAGYAFFQLALLMPTLRLLPNG
jgi:hypothetical protein